MKTGVNAIDSDDEEENAIQEKKIKYKKLDMKKVMTHLWWVIIFKFQIFRFKELKMNHRKD